MFTIVAMDRPGSSDAANFSDDPIQRKNARLARIERRSNAIARSEIEADNTLEVENEECISLVEKQAAECAAVIEHLLADGEERVTNVRVANDAREISRRFKQLQKKRELLKQLEDEALLAKEKFEQISAKWSEILQLNSPLDIEVEMKAQKKRCDDLTLQKDILIEELKEELTQADDTFYKDLYKQLSDIKQIGERIDSQVNLMKKAYRSQLQLIETSIEIERANIIDKNEKQWNVLYQQRNIDEVENTENKFSQIKEFKQKMDSLAIIHREKYRETKIQLENEIQALQKELQELKATCFINSEKIDYTYHILKQREEENVSVKSQQKRRLNKMQDVITELKQKVKNIKKITNSEKLKSAREIEKLQGSMNDLQKKANHFTTVNEIKYQQVWRMNKIKSLDYIKKINAMDKIIHEKILGINWTEPKLIFFKCLDMLSYKNVANSSIIMLNYDSANSESDESESNINDETKKRLINHILKLIADTSGFLIDKKLWEILNKYEVIPATVCKIDTIFNALGIKSEDDMKILYKYFSKYSFCQECENNQINVLSEHGSDNALTSQMTDTISSPAQTNSENLGENDKKYDAVCQHCKTPLKINNSDVLNGLRDFTCRSKIENKLIYNATPAKYEMISTHLLDKDVSAYWEQYKNAFAPQRDKLWDNLLIGLSQYLPILQDRYKLNDDVIQLRKQNLELKNLLRGHMPSIEVPKQKYLTPLNKKLDLS